MNNMVTRPEIMDCSVSFFSLLSVLLWMLFITPNGAAIINTDTNFAKNYLIKYGYIDGTSSRSASQMTLDMAVRRFQDFAGLRVTGVLDEKTMHKMAQPRCGVKDIIRVRSRRQAPGQDFGKWPQNHLTYKILQNPASMNQETTNREIRRAFEMWSSVSNLSITQVAIDHNDADMEVMFAKGDHGDHEPFDGPKGMLGHAFFPPFGGNTHFDDAEDWTADQSEGVNLFQVATHEFGHALGLGHSKNQQALMAPFYQPYSTNFSLQQDDIKEIRRLYGDKLLFADVAPTKTEVRGPILSSPLATTMSSFSFASTGKTNLPATLAKVVTNGTVTAASVTVGFKPQTRWYQEGPNRVERPGPTVAYYYPPDRSSYGTSYGTSSYPSSSYTPSYTPYYTQAPSYGGYNPYQSYGGSGYGSSGGYGPTNYYPSAQVPMYPVYPTYYYPDTTTEKPTTTEAPTTRGPIIIYVSAPAPASYSYPQYPMYPYNPYAYFPAAAPTPAPPTPAPTPAPTTAAPTTTTSTTTTTTTTPQPFFYYPGSGYGNFGGYVAGYPNFGPPMYTGTSPGAIVQVGTPTPQGSIIQVGTPTPQGSIIFTGTPTPPGVGSILQIGTPSGSPIIQGTPIFRGSTMPISFAPPAGVSPMPKAGLIEDPNGGGTISAASEDAVQVKFDLDDNNNINRLTDNPMDESGGPENDVNTRADLCSIDTPDAVVSIGNNTFVFKGKVYWVLDRTWISTPQRPVTDLVPEFDHVDAGYFKAPHLLLFSGTSYHKFEVNGNQLLPLPGYPKLISQGYPGLPDAPVDEVIRRGSQLWFFRDRNVTIYNPEKFPPINPETGFMKTTDIEGFPEKVTASVVDEEEGKGSFAFHNRAAYRLSKSDVKLRASTRRFPRTVKEWLKCAHAKRWQ